MPKETNRPTQQLVLVDHNGLGRIHVDVEAFFGFSFWLAEELEDLTASWKHKSTPKAAGDFSGPVADRF